ncbi:MAG TPA: hypothetical protein VMU26_18795 [Candidatus Polarisedimenticolia bacterium]|nr:hypothetical protein [Candidatus Polarisedimenticolia bacterium]
MDEYLCDGRQSELGLKRRGGKPGVEVKGLVDLSFSTLDAGDFVGPIELWTKWTTEILELESKLTIPVKKVRWLRKFDTTLPVVAEVPLDSREQPLGGSLLPARGCNVELTQIDLPEGQIWWSFGFESFGTIQTVAKDLEAAAIMLTKRGTPPLQIGLLASYPSWLRQHCVR